MLHSDQGLLLLGRGVGSLPLQFSSRRACLTISGRAHTDVCTRQRQCTLGAGETSCISLTGGCTRCSLLGRPGYDPQAYRGALTARKHFRLEFAWLTVASQHFAHPCRSETVLRDHENRLCWVGLAQAVYALQTPATFCLGTVSQRPWTLPLSHEVQ